MAIFQNFVRSLVGMPTDPTEDWPDYRDNELIVAPDKLEVGGMKFGDRLASAEFLGRPNSVSWIRAEYCSLLYADGGFQLDFENELFCYAGIFLDRHQAEPEERYTLASPQVTRPGDDPIALSNGWKAANIAEWFGQPSEIDKDEAETILFYRNDALTMEFELKPEVHTLARWNLFPSD